MKIYAQRLKTNDDPALRRRNDVIRNSLPALDGATSGASKVIIPAMAAGGRAVFNGASFPDEFKYQSVLIGQEQDEVRQRHPIWYYGSQLAGAAATGKFIPIKPSSALAYTSVGGVSNGVQEGMSTDGNLIDKSLAAAKGMAIGTATATATRLMRPRMQSVFFEPASNTILGKITGVTGDNSASDQNRSPKIMAIYRNSGKMWDANSQTASLDLQNDIDARQRTLSPAQQEAELLFSKRLIGPVQKFDGPVPAFALGDSFEEALPKDLAELPVISPNFRGWGRAFAASHAVNDVEDAALGNIDRRRAMFEGNTCSDDALIPDRGNYDPSGWKRLRY